MGLLSRLFSSEPKPGKPQAITTTDEFESEVMGSEIPVVVDFWSPTCSPCQVMGGLLNELGPEFVGRVTVAKLNVSDIPEIAVRFGVQSVPTLITFRNGRPIDRLVGLAPLDILKQRFEEYAKLAPPPEESTATD